MRPATKRNKRWIDTELRRLARERNWCMYMLDGMVALVDVIARFTGEQTALIQLRRSIRSVRQTVEYTYSDRINSL